MTVMTAVATMMLTIPVTTAEVAAQTGWSVATINRWADSGVLPVAVKAPGLRGARMFRQSDVDKIEPRERETA